MSDIIFSSQKITRRLMPNATPKSFVFRYLGMALMLLATAFAANAAPIVQYFQGFEVNNVWGDPPTDPTQVASGTGGITSKTGAFHAQAVSGNFTRWGGYNSVFPTYGFTTSIDIYLDMAGGYGNDTRFDWSSAVSDTAGAHRRDFIFNGGFFNDAGPYGSGPRFVFSASNNAPGNPRNPGRNPVAVTATGWYTLTHTFMRGAGDVLIVKMQIINSSNVVVGTWFLSDASDVIGTTVGGNRYGWLVTSAFPFLAIDNSQRVDLDGAVNTVVINQHDINNWLFYNDAASGPEGPDPTCGSFVTGPGTTPLGIGSAQVSVSGQRRCNLSTYQFAGTPLSAITTFKYSTYNPSAGNGGSPNRSGFLLFNVDFNGSDTWQRRLIYVPSQNGTVIQDNWQEWDAINGGNANWGYSGATWPAGIGEPGTTPGTTTKTWNQILATYPGVRIRVTDAHLGIRVGEPYVDGYTENIDSFKFGTGAGYTQFDFDPASTFNVVPATSPTAFDNDYTRINNAVQAAPAGSTIILNGTFNWTEPNAAASWAKGSDGLSGTPALDNDNYSILPPANRNGITITAASLGAATIQGPGDLSGANLEGVFQYYNDGDNQNTTISNLQIYDFDLPIAMFNGAGGTDAYNGTKILNNHIRVARDLNATVASADVNQNIGIHYSFGVNQQISGNTIDLYGDGVSDAPNYSTEVGMQSNTSGGNAYSGLQITNNTIRVLNAQDATNPERIRGIWENGHAHSSNITISGNQFVNLAGGNNRATNKQEAFWITSHSSASTTVTYSNNTVSGANIGFKWLGNPEYPGTDFSGNQAVRLTSNTIVNNATGILVQSQGLANLKFNRIVGNTTGVNNVDGTVDGANNWWGCNYGPGATGAGCPGPVNGTTGTVPSAPWLTLSTSASPTNIGLGNTSTVVSKLTINSAATDTSGSGNVPNGMPVGFAGVLGTVAPSSSTTTLGVSGTTFTATAFGSGGTNTTVDGQTVSAAITVTASCNVISIPTTLTTLTGTTVIVPVNIDDTTGRGIYSADIWVSYNPAVVTFASASLGSVPGASILTTNNTAGLLKISIFNNNPFAGLGQLVNVTFNAVGLPGTSSAMTFTQAKLNEGTPCSSTSNGLVTILSGTITGTVTYGNALVGAAPPRYVPNVTLNAVGSVNVSANTGPVVSNGQYTLSGMGAGAYTVTPSKTGGAIPGSAAISGYDSAAIAQHVVNLTTLNSTQLIVADVSGTGGVTSFDAALIARWAASLPGSGSTGTWTFTPANRSYANVNANQTAQDYTALLMGDVTGNWDENGGVTRPPVNPDEDPLMIIAPRRDASSGTSLAIPVSIGDTTGAGIRSYQFDLRYDPAVLQPAAEPVDLADTVSRDMVATANSTEPGLLRVVVFGAHDLAGKGDLFNLRFDVIGPVETSTDLTWENFVINEGGVNFRTENGRVNVVASNSDAKISGRVLTPFGRGLRGTRVTVTDINGGERSVLTNVFGYFEVSGLEVGHTYTVRAASRLYRFTPQTVSLDGSAVTLELIANE